MITHEWLLSFEASDHCSKEPLSFYNITKAPLYSIEKPLGTWGHCCFYPQRPLCQCSVPCHVNTIHSIKGPPPMTNTTISPQGPLSKAFTFHINKTTCENNLDCFKLRPLSTQFYHKQLVISLKTLHYRPIEIFLKHYQSCFGFANTQLRITRTELQSCTNLSVLNILQPILSIETTAMELVKAYIVQYLSGRHSGSSIIDMSFVQGSIMGDLYELRVDK